MSMTDPIADMITRIRNAQQANKSDVNMPSSKAKVNIAKVLKEEGYIAYYNVSSVKGKKSLLILLKYYDGKPVISRIDRVSSPGLRIYKSTTELPKVIGGLGMAVVSTSHGVMADHEARIMGHGGEIICTVS